jgi:long-subunit fatty acid transport protein
MDLDYTFLSGGISHDITDKFSAQGVINYVKCSGINENGNDVKWSQIIPTCALKYNFNENTELLLAYTYYNYNSDTPYDVYDSVPDSGGNNNYSANRVITRLRMKF